MFGFDALELARLQFAFTVSFHIIFPAFSIGLASYLAVLNGLHLRTGQPIYLNLFNYWKTIFAVAFGMGVVSGIVMSYQFGTNWSVFSDKAGPIIGPLMGYEVLSAFFLEAGFLGVMLFGRDKVGPRLHFFATLMVAVGTLGSAFWILSVNSWMQTPQGYGINALGQFIPEDWWAIVFNPSFPYRLGHMLLASGLTAAFLIAGVSAWQMLKGTTTPGTARALRTSLIAAALLIPLQIFMGDLHGLNTLKHQPAKIAAMEGIWHTEAGAPLTLFGIPNEAEQRTDYAITIPKLASLILAHDPNAELKGLNEFKDAHPPVAPVFFGFRIMVGLGVLMLVVAWWGALALWRNRRQEQPAASLSRPLLWALVGMTFSGWLATLAGWYVTEVGRQPYLVYGVFRTADAVAANPAPTVLGTLIAYLVVYVALLVAYVGVIKHMAEHAHMPAAPKKPQALPARTPVAPRHGMA